MTNNDIVQKLWNLCDVLRDDGINYSDYVTELVLLLFIKMVHENTEAGTLKTTRCRKGAAGKTSTKNPASTCSTTTSASCSAFPPVKTTTATLFTKTRSSAPSTPTPRPACANRAIWNR